MIGLLTIQKYCQKNCGVDNFVLRSRGLFMIKIDLMIIIICSCMLMKKVRKFRWAICIILIDISKAP